MPQFGDVFIGTDAWIAFAISALLAPVLFVAVVATAIRRRGPTGTIGPRLTAAVAGTGGLALGVMLPMGGDVMVLLPIVGVAIALVYGLLRRGRRREAGWIVLGLAAPSTALFAYGAMYGVAPGRSGSDTIAGWLVVGIAASLLGAVLIRRGDPPPPAPDPSAPAGQPGSRSYASIAEAIRATARIGPFGIPELAMLIATVIAWLVVPFLIPSTTPFLLKLAIPVLVVSAIGTEVYVRAWPAPSRRAFEAFSWLGEYNLARARQLTGEAVPTTKAGAASWLARRPERTEELTIRIELLLFVGRTEDARALLARLPEDTPTQRFLVVGLRDFFDWHAGGEGDVAAMEAAAGAILPEDGDERLRADLSIATAKVRRRMAEARLPALAIIEPLLEVRNRLGARADGQLGRALRRRIFPWLVVTTGVLVGAAQLLGGPSRPVS